MHLDTFTSGHVSMSLDGFLAGPDQSADAPLGRGGLALHRWHLDRGQGGRIVDKLWADSILRPRGAYLMGRNMFGPVRGPWSSYGGEWRGWWGEDPPYHAPVVVLTHHEHPPIEMAGGTTFHFVTEGFAAGLARARELGGGDVAVAGGAATLRQALVAGELDELALDIAPVLLGTGERLFDGTATPDLQIIEAQHSVYATHVRYRIGSRLP